MDVVVAPDREEHLAGNIFQWDCSLAKNSFDVDRVAYAELRKNLQNDGHDVYTINQIDLNEADVLLIIDDNLQYLHDALSKRSPPAIGYVMRESPAVRGFNSEVNLLRWAPAFDGLFTWNDSLADQNEHFFQYNWPQNNKADIRKDPSFGERKLLVNISSRKHSQHPNELYSSREDVIQYYSENYPEQFDLYGWYWDQPARAQELLIHHEVLPKKYPTVYRGETDVDEKSAVYADYKFALCFENQAGIDGWITEKLFDCFRAGVVPIYWGADNVSEYIPSETYIDYRDIQHPEPLHQHLSSISKREWVEMRENGIEFLKNTDAVSPERFAESLREGIEWIAEHGHHPPPSDMKEQVRWYGLADRLSNETESLSRKEIATGLSKLLTNRPRVAFERPGSLYHSARSFL